MLIVDLDDFAEDSRSLADLRRLDELRAVIPTFKATLFTIGGRCSKGFIADIKASRPWLELVPHGWKHETNRECEKWDRYDCLWALDMSANAGLKTRGFKAPGWQISDGCYAALLDQGYWVADQIYNDERRPAGLKAYRLMPEGETGVGCYARMDNGNINRKIYFGARQIHGHIGALNGHNANALEIIAPQILAAAEHDTDFRFISEVME